jgi:hypothetical protein
MDQALRSALGSGAEVVERAERARDVRAAAVDQAQALAGVDPADAPDRDPGAGGSGGDGVATRRQRGEHQLVVVAAGEQALALHLQRLGGEHGAARQGVDVDDGTDAGLAQQWPRSPVRPSETSMALVATPRRRMPRAVRGAGSSIARRTCAKASASSATWPRNASSARRASPSVPLT